MMRLGLSCSPAISSPSDKNFLSSNPKYDFFFHIWGVLGGPLYRTQGYQMSIYINLHIKYRSNSISYRVNDEMSADVAA